MGAGCIIEDIFSRPLAAFSNPEDGGRNMSWLDTRVPLPDESGRIGEPQTPTLASCLVNRDRASLLYASWLKN